MIDTRAPVRVDVLYSIIVEPQYPVHQFFDAPVELLLLLELFDDGIYRIFQRLRQLAIILPEGRRIVLLRHALRGGFVGELAVLINIGKYGASCDLLAP